ncbi:MAG: hypothetical protein ACMXYL_00605 [Candidatus Woesearchaeota archaeon]
MMRVKAMKRISILRYYCADHLIVHAMLLVHDTVLIGWSHE